MIPQGQYGLIAAFPDAMNHIPSILPLKQYDIPRQEGTADGTDRHMILPESDQRMHTVSIKLNLDWQTDPLSRQGMPCFYGDIPCLGAAIVFYHGIHLCNLGLDFWGRKMYNKIYCVQLTSVNTYFRVKKVEIVPTDYQYSIAVCDDEAPDLNQIAGMTEAHFDSQGISCSIHPFPNGTSLLEAIQGGEKFHLLLLDVMMDELDGMELASALRAQKNETSIVFISSNREMALRGYEVAAARYLGKPVDAEKLHEALTFCYQNYHDARELLFPTTKGARKISPSDILFAEAGERGVKLFLSHEQVDTSMRMFELEAMLPQTQFVLCHRAFLVNLAYARYIRCYEVELQNGLLVPVSKHRYAETKQKLIQYLKL